jgi:putative hydrolase of the HAD superfamily
VPPAPIHGLTIDLDDTLWPFAPVGQAIEGATRAWLAEHAPGSAPGFSRERFLELAVAVRAEREDPLVDLGALHLEVLRRMLARGGDDAGLAEALYEVANEARQQVVFHPDAEPALDRLAARFPIVAVTNGNADFERIGLDRWMRGHVRADLFGVAKPAAPIFHAACELLGLPAANVLHVGDDLEADVGGALAAGMQAAWVHREVVSDTPPGVMRVRDLGALADALL